MPDGFTECLDAKDIVKLHTMSRYTQALKKHAMGLAHQSAQAVNDACGNSDNASLKQKNIPALVADAAMELRHMLLEKSAFDVYWNDIQGGKHKIPMLALDTPLDSTSMKARTVKKLIHSPQTLMYRSVLQHQKAAQGYAAQLSDQDKVKGSERVSLEQKLQQEIQWLQKNIPEGIAA
jgi:hypothetical protein